MEINILNMRVSAKTVPARLASAVVRHLQEDPELTIIVSAIGEMAQGVAAEAMGIAQGYAARENLTLNIEDGECQCEVEDRTFGVKPGTTKTVIGRQFTVTVEPIGADPE